MGAEQSLYHTIAQPEDDATVAENPYNKTALHTSNVPFDHMSDEFKQFLHAKQSEFNQMLRERDRLRIETASNELALASLLEAYVNMTEQLQNERVDCAADGMAWQAIADGATSVLASCKCCDAGVAGVARPTTG